MRKDKIDNRGFIIAMTKDFDKDLEFLNALPGRKLHNDQETMALLSEYNAFFIYPGTLGITFINKRENYYDMGEFIEVGLKDLYENS